MDTGTLFFVATDALTYAVLALFILWPFRQVLRYSLPVTGAITFVFGVFSCWIFNLFYGPGSTSAFTAYADAAMMLWFFSALFILALCIRQNVLHLLFLLCLVVHTASDLAAIALFLVHLIPVDFSLHANLFIAQACLLVMALPFFWFIMVFLYPRVLAAQISSAYWSFLWMIPAFLYIIFVSRFAHHYQDAPPFFLWGEFFFLIVWNISTYLMFCVILIMLIKAYASDSAEAQAQLINKQLDMQKTQYNKLVQYIQTSATLRHDWRQHIRTLTFLSESGQFEEIQDYLAVYKSRHFVEDAEVLCQNIAVDAILHHYLAKARDENIPFDMQVNVPADLSVQDVDLCLVIGNLLENAMEACKDVAEKSNAFVRLKIRPVQNQLLISVENTYTAPPNSQKESFFSTKHPGPALGIPSARHVAEKYGGFLDIRAENNVFLARVAFCLEKNEKKNT